MDGSIDVTRWDIYREVHKGMRRALFLTTLAAGATDATAEADVASLVDHHRETLFLLRAHHGHEDEFLDPLVHAHAAHLRSAVEAGHQATSAMMAALDRQADDLAQLPAPQRAAALRRYYLDLAAFTSAYLEHLAFEEEVVMPALQAALDDAALEAVTVALRGSVTPPDMCRFVAAMAPALDPAERLDMLGGMHQGAPPEVFELFRAAAERALPPDAYAQVAQRAGFG